MSFKLPIGPSSSSRRIAGLLGPTLIAISTTEAMNMGIYTAQSAPVVYLNGTVLFVAGLAIVQSHGHWRLHWMTLITLTGWGALALGLLRMTFPSLDQAGDHPATYMLLALLLLVGVAISIGAFLPRLQLGTKAVPGSPYRSVRKGRGMMEKRTEHETRNAEARLLCEMRSLRRSRHHLNPAAVIQLTHGQRIADQVAAMMGSWRFIIIQTSILVVWIVLNVTAFALHWDPYPFILLNLALSFQAAYAAPFIMMSQNRQQDIDRREAESDYRINIKAELEIELLHDKIEQLHSKFDQLRDKEILALVEAVQRLSKPV